MEYKNYLKLGACFLAGALAIYGCQKKTGIADGINYDLKSEIIAIEEDKIIAGEPLSPPWEWVH